MTDFFKALRASWRFFLRDLRYRNARRKRIALPDPLETT